jgi:hypothetical protein
MSTFPVFIDGVGATLFTILNPLLRHCLQNFVLFVDTGLAMARFSLVFRLTPRRTVFFCLLDCTVVSDLSSSCDVLLGRDWFTYASHTIPNATIRLSEIEYLDFGSPQKGIRVIEEGMSSLQ